MLLVVRSGGDKDVVVLAKGNEGDGEGRDRGKEEIRGLRRKRKRSCR